MYIMIECYTFRYFSINDNQRLPKSLDTISLIDWCMMGISLLISVGTAYLAAGCHDPKPSKFHHVLIVTFAFFFPLMYLLYYFFRFIIFGEACSRHR